MLDDMKRLRNSNNFFCFDFHKQNLLSDHCVCQHNLEIGGTDNSGGTTQ